MYFLCFSFEISFLLIIFSLIPNYINKHQRRMYYSNSLSDDVLTTSLIICQFLHFEELFSIRVVSCEVKLCSFSPFFPLIVSWSIYSFSFLCTCKLEVVLHLVLCLVLQQPQLSTPRFWYSTRIPISVTSILLLQMVSNCTRKPMKAHLMRETLKTCSRRSIGILISCTLRPAPNSTGFLRSWKLPTRLEPNRACFKTIRNWLWRI